MIVSALPLTPDGEPDAAVLERLPVCDQPSFADWEAAARAISGDDSLRIEEIDAPANGPRLHLTDLAVDTPLAESGASSPPENRFASVAASTSTIANAIAGKPSISVGPPLPVSPDLPKNLGACLHRAAASYPDHGFTYLYEDGPDISETFPELLARAQRILHGLRALGLAAGDKVIFQLREPRQFVGAFWACQLGGFVTLPIAEAPSYHEANPANQKLRLAWDLLERPLILTREAQVDSIRQHSRAWSAAGARVAAIEDLDTGARDESPAAVKESDLAVLLLTSGSTGVPKAVMQSHRAVLARSLAAQMANGFTPNDVTLNWLPMDHVGGLLMCHVQDVYVGCREVLAGPDAVLRRPLTWLDWADRYRATYTWAPNFAFGLVISQPDVDRQSWDLSSLRFILNGGEAIVPRVARRFLEVLQPYGLPATAMNPAWGMSETCSGTAYSHRFARESTSDDDHFTVVGHPVPGFSIRIVNEANVPVPEGRTGRLQVSGPCVTTGYFRNAQNTAEAFTPDGWFVTGDLGVLRDGALTITGREKNVIIVNGANYHSHEIESVVEEVPGVAASFTAAVPVRRKDGTTEDVAIFFVPASPTPELPAGLVRAVSDHVRKRAGLSPGYVLPVGRGDIPKTEVGKIQHGALTRQFDAGHFDRLLRELDLACNNERVVPNWFFRREWRRKNLPAAPANPDRRPLLVFADEVELAAKIAAACSAAGRRCITVLHGTGFKSDAADRFVVDPENHDSYQALWHALEGAALNELSVVSLHTAPLAAGVTDAAREPALLLTLLHALANRPFAGQRLRLHVVSTAAFSVASSDPTPWRSAIGGLLRTAVQEYPWLVCHQVDVESGSAADVIVQQVVAELDCDAPDPTVAYRGGHRQVPGFSRLAVAPAEKTPSVLRSGGFYAISGGAGGIGQLVARWLTAQYSAQVLLLGRRPGASLEMMRDGVTYRSIDIADAAAVDAALTEAEQRAGKEISGIIHLAGVFDETALEDLTIENLHRALSAKVAGTVALAQFASRRKDCPLVIFSSVNGFFGGVSAGAYSAANAFVDEFAAGCIAHGQDVRSLAWTLWDETGMSVGYALKQLSHSRGFFVLNPRAAMTSLAFALCRSERQLWIGLDSSRPAISRHCGRECRSLSTAVARSESAKRSIGLADAFGQPFQIEPRASSPAGSAASGNDAGAVPSNELERLVANAWTRVLSLPAVGVEENFFDCGGNSISLARVNAELRTRLGRPVPMPAMFQHPTVRALAAFLGEAGEPETAASQDSADARGALRRARMQGRRSLQRKVH